MFVKETIHVKIQSLIDGQYILTSVYTELRGRGGAIFLQVGDLTVKNCRLRTTE